MDNPLIELVNGSFRDQCLNGLWFLSFEDAHDIIERWHFDYNLFRPNRSLDDITPEEF